MSQPWHPLQDLMILQDRMNRLFEDATKRRSSDEAGDRGEFESIGWTPAADLYESEADYLIAIDLPGINRQAVEIDLDEGRLIIKGKRELEKSTKELAERPAGNFFRSFNVPTSVDQGLIEAEYKDGVLEIRLPKRTEQKSNRVEIKVS